MDNQSLSHSRYNCTYHIVFIPKYRRKVMFGDLRREVGEVISKICRLEGVTIIKAATLPDHVHMYVSIPPKESVAKIGLYALEEYLKTDYLVVSIDFQKFGTATYESENSFALSFADCFLNELDRNEIGRAHV